MHGCLDASDAGETASCGNGRYSALSRMARIGERMRRLKVDVQPRVGAARDPNGRSATCNGGKCRETRRTARRWRCSRDGLAPDGNLVIAERCED